MFTVLSPKWAIQYKIKKNKKIKEHNKRQINDNTYNKNQNKNLKHYHHFEINPHKHCLFFKNSQINIYPL